MKAGLSIREEGRERFVLWETHLWLEASINIGRAERHLYQLKKTKITFWTIVKILSETNQHQAYSWESRFEGHENVLAQMDSIEPDPDILSRLPADSGLYTEYMTQALAQLGIAYQKNRDYELAQELSRLVLDINCENIDAANNLAVCLRKIASQSGRSIRIPEKYTPQQQEKPDYLSMPYGAIFMELRHNGNRFATLHTLKCHLHAPKMNRRSIGG